MAEGITLRMSQLGPIPDHLLWAARSQKDAVRQSTLSIESSQSLIFSATRTSMENVGWKVDFSEAAYLRYAVRHWTN